MMSVVWDEPEQSQRHSQNIMWWRVEKLYMKRVEYFAILGCMILILLFLCSMFSFERAVFFVINALWHYARHSTVYAQLINNYYLFGCNFLAIMMRMVVIRWKSQRKNFIQFSPCFISEKRCVQYKWSRKRIKATKFYKRH